MASETWFLLRGLTREKAHWGDFAPALAAALPEADVHLLDLPGAGDRHAEAWTGGVADALAVLHAEAARLAPPTPGVRRFVFGVSLGGMVALEWAARYPDELTGVVVGNSSAGDLSPWWRRMQPGALPTILR
ncbi:MAG: alpha/beta fold hydrolase, partial [Myxococcales bacterium]|nr:alpha/beta fold hydrolase [Myxococcales bacterium]